MLLGAAIAGGDPQLLAPAFRDRLHEPYRAAGAPLLERVRAAAAPGLIGVTLSGSGPTVIVWAGDEAVDECAAELAARFPREQVLPLQTAGSGAGAV